MSAYSDLQCGAITEEEYNDYCRWEADRDRYFEEKEFYEEESEDENDVD